MLGLELQQGKNGGPRFVLRMDLQIRQKLSGSVAYRPQDITSLFGGACIFNVELEGK